MNRSPRTKARLAVTRQKGFPSWEALLEAAEAKHLADAPGAIDPMPFVAKAMAAADLADCSGSSSSIPICCVPQRSSRLAATA